MDVFEKTDWDALIPEKDFSLDKAHEKAINNKEYVICAMTRLNKPSTVGEIEKEVYSILIDQVLLDLVNEGILKYDGGKRGKAKFTMPSESNNK